VMMVVTRWQQDGIKLLLHHTRVNRRSHEYHMTVRHHAFLTRLYPARSKRDRDTKFKTLLVSRSNHSPKTTLATTHIIYDLLFRIKVLSLFNAKHQYRYIHQATYQTPHIYNVFMQSVSYHVVSADIDDSLCKILTT
jgi:hypothetical protein